MDLNDNFAKRSILSDKLSAAVDTGIDAKYFCMAKIWLKPIKITWVNSEQLIEVASKYRIYLK
jgi:hypothetical protein